MNTNQLLFFQINVSRQHTPIIVSLLNTFCNLKHIKTAHCVKHRTVSIALMKTYRKYLQFVSSSLLLQEGSFNINRTYYVIHPENSATKQSSYEDGVRHRTKKVKMPKGNQDKITYKYTNKQLSPNARSLKRK